MTGPAAKSLGTFEKAALWLAFVVVVPVVGGLVEHRSAFLSRRMGDLGVFLRAGWAVRTHADPYAVACDNDWHFCYPPLFAILIAPLADPPHGADTAGFVPYAWSVFIFFLCNVVGLYAGVHCLAAALEANSGDVAVRAQPTFCRRWWHLRFWPLAVCFLPIVHAAVRGQVNILVLATLCAALAGWIRGRHFRAGLWLSLAICIKVIPIYLLVYPLWKRDWRSLAGCGVGLAAGLVLVPLLTFGPAKTLAHYDTYAKVFFAPLLKINDDASRRNELLGVNATDSVGVNNAIFNWMHPDEANRPADLAHHEKLVYLLLGCAMTFVTLWQPTGIRFGGEAARIPLTFGSLIVLMTIFSPVCHTHYLLFCLPIVMSLLASSWQYQDSLRPPWVLVVVFAIYFVTIGLSHLPSLEILKDRCAPLFATLPLWAIPVVRLWRNRTEKKAAVAAPPAQTAMRRAA